MSEDELLSIIRGVESRVTPSAALEELLGRFYELILRIAMVEFREREIAMDCTQEVMLRAARTIHRFRGDSKFSTWLVGIERHVIRELKRTRREVVDVIAQENVGGKTPTTKTELHAEFSFLLHELRLLPERQRQVITLFYLEDFPIPQIAEALRCSQSAVKTHLSRGRETLRAALELYRKQ